MDLHARANALSALGRWELAKQAVVLAESITPRTLAAQALEHYARTAAAHAEDDYRHWEMQVARSEGAPLR